VLAFLFAALAPLLLAKLLNDGINEAVVIDSPTAPSYQAWEKNIEGPGSEMGPISYDLFFFDVQNPQQILQGGKPIVVERGPYSYREYYRKFDVKFSEGGDVVSYNKQTYYVFDAENSVPGASENDTFTLINPVAVSLQYLLSTIPVNASVLLDAFLQSKLLSAKVKLDNGLEDAYSKVDAIPQKLLPQKDEILQAIAHAESEVDAIYGQISSFVSQSSPTTLLLKLLLGPQPQGVSPFFKIRPGPGYFGYLNDSILLEVQAIVDLLPVPVPWTSAVVGADVNWTSIEDRRRRRGPDTLRTGKNNKLDIAQYIYWQNQAQDWGCIAPMNSQDPRAYTEGVDFPACEIFDSSWNRSTAESKGYRLACASDEANAIRGTNGEQFGRPLLDTHHLDIFVGSIYRSLHLDRVATTDDWYGVSLDRYEIKLEDFQNATTVPSNSQYFSFGPNGLLNMTEAVNAPSFVSYPHFYLADPSLSEEIIGLSPTADGDVHMTYLDIEPNTGMLARAHKVLQNSFLLTAQHFPTTNTSFADGLLAVCANISTLIQELNIDKNMSVPVPSCSNMTAALAVLDIMAARADWDIRRQPTTGNNEVFLPSSWVREATVGTQQSAEDIKTSVYFVQDLAKGVGVWGLVTGGVLLAVALGMLIAIRMSAPPARSTAVAKERAGSLTGRNEDEDVDEEEPGLTTALLD